MSFAPMPSAAAITPRLAGVDIARRSTKGWALKSHGKSVEVQQDLLAV